MLRAKTSGLGNVVRHLLVEPLGPWFESPARRKSIFVSPLLVRARKKAEIKQKGKIIKPVNPELEKDLPIYEFGSKNPAPIVYTWGMACTGALGSPHFLRPKNKSQHPLQTMHRPARCQVAERIHIKDLACGYGFTIFAVSSPKCHIMGTGINKSGQFGYIAVRKDHPLELLIQPVGVILPVKDENKSRVIKVAAGREHSLALTNDGDIFALGNNSYGQLGRPVIEDEDYFRNPVPGKVVGPWDEDGDGVEDIYCGQDHSIFRTKSGRLFSCGWGPDGQTGLGHYDSTACVTQITKGDLRDEKVVKAATSTDCVLALNDKGEVFGWGNSEYGQFASVTEEQQLCIPRKLDMTGLGKIIDVACGGTVCLVLNENHDVFVWGYGILGKGPKLDFSKVPTQIPNTLFGRNDFSPDVRVQSVHASVHTQAAINNQGELFMWGKNKGSCLGLGDSMDQFFPLRVSILHEVKKISLGIDHTAAICNPLA